MRLDSAVAQAFDLSRRAAREAVRSGRVEVDGIVCDRPGREVPASAALSFHPSRPARHPVHTRLSVLAEDDDFLVVEKPAGLLSVPTAEHERDTLLARVSDFLQKRYRRRPYVGVAHRLDKDTSGALVFARSRPALRHLQELFRSHRIEREYVAIVEGRLPDSGTFSADLVRDGGDRRRGVARAGQTGRPALTRYRVLERLGEATLVSIELETGRTHQIRVHFACAGHPVLGDPVYRPRRAPPPPIPAPRQMLHARRLGFAHPRTGEPVRTESPIPEDLREVLARLRKKSRAESRGSRDPDKKKAPRNPRGARNPRL
ncbi:MAG: RluA family pseudouridine synthase [Thermoanaerobaculia bacterium]